MSAQKTPSQAAAAHARVTIQQNAAAAGDLRRGDFLLDLDSDDSIEVTLWEARFIQRFVDQPKHSPVSFSLKQRFAIDEMMTRYEPRPRKKS